MQVIPSFRLQVYKLYEVFFMFLGADLEKNSAALFFILIFL